MCSPGKRNELTPRHLTFDAASHSLWCQFADSVERDLAPFGRYEAIKGLANKLPEHAARIAGVMTLFQDFYSATIKAETLQAAINLTQHFADEALRLWDAGMVRPEIALAESLLEWLTKRWSEPFVSVRPIIQFGPNAIRDAKIARATLAILEEHGWVSKAPTGTLISGVAAREAWKISGR
jgi:hypothetical protein